MKNKKVAKKKSSESKKVALHYMAAPIDVARESFLILDSDLRVVLANPKFYESFRVVPEQTVGRFVYDLGNGQWDIPELKKLLQEVLPEKKIVRDYEVVHVFQTIGKKAMFLNAEQIDSVQLIILAIEDVSDKKELAQRIKELEALNATMVGRELKMVELKKEIENLKERAKNGNGESSQAILASGENGNRKNDQPAGMWGNGGHRNGGQQ